LISLLGLCGLLSQAVADVQARCGKSMDGLVLCAGLGPQTKVVGNVVSVNYFGATELLDAFLPLLEQGGGRLGGRRSHDVREWDLVFNANRPNFLPLPGTKQTQETQSWLTLFGGIHYRFWRLRWRCDLRCILRSGRFRISPIGL
jgi:hypothetical protein